MKEQEKRLLRLIEINHDCRTLADRLNAISARRRKKRIRSSDK